VAGQTVEVALGNPGPSATFSIPADLVPFVDSVYAEIDNGAGSDATPTLEIRGPNGDTVAAIPQDDVVPGGDTGRATWALRLPGKKGRGGNVSASVIYARGYTDTAFGDAPIVVPAGGSILAPMDHVDADASGVITWETNVNPNDTARMDGPGLFMVQTSAHFQTLGAGEVAFPYVAAGDEWPTTSWGGVSKLDNAPFTADPSGTPTNLSYALVRVPAASSHTVSLMLEQNLVVNVNVTQAYMSIIGYPGV
jgi:hypothetical protein